MGSCTAEKDDGIEATASLEEEDMKNDMLLSNIESHNCWLSSAKLESQPYFLKFICWPNYHYYLIQVSYVFE